MHSFEILAAMIFRGSPLCLLVLLLTVEALELKIFDETTSSTMKLDVSSHRIITLGPGRSYMLGCSPHSAEWSSNLITNRPNDDTVSAVFYESSSSKNNLNMQNFSSALSGNYTCSLMGEEKSVMVLSSNPAVVTSAQKLFLKFKDTPSENDREQRILMSGVPSPTLNDIIWLLNDTIPVSTLPEITVDMNGLKFPPLTTYDLCGRYTIVVNTSAGMVQDSFTVSVGIEPFPVVTPSTIQAVVGEKKNITCVDTQAVPPPQFYWSKCVVKNNVVNCTRLENGQDDLFFLSTRSNTTVLIMDPVQLTYGGLYRCEAKNSHNEKARGVTVELSLPQPQSVNLSVTPGPYFAGHSAQLICTTSLVVNSFVEYDSIIATFVWKKGNQIIDTSNERLSVTDLMTHGSLRSQQMSIDPLSHSHDSHQQYACEVVLAVNDTDIASLPMISATVSIDVKVPQTVIHVSPKRITALDVPPYNEFGITCSSENPRNFSLEYKWLKGKEELAHGQDGVSIAANGYNQSVINIVASEAGFYIVSCKVRGSFLDQELFNVELGSSITIRGPSVPLLPTGLTTTRISYNQVDIELLVNNISYTPEQYFVAYGTNSQYQYRSEVHTGNTDFTTVGERLTITLTNLQYNQQYQYRVVAQNSVGTVSSKVFSFRTETLVLLQVRAGPFQGCRANKVQHSSLVSEFFRATIVDAINRRCFCNFPIANLINGTALCPQDGSRDLVYRGYLVRLDHLSSKQLLSYAEAWIKSRPHISSGVAVVEFNPNCSTTVSTMNESVCPRQYVSSPAAQGFSFDNVVILVVTVVIALILVLVIIVLILVGVVVSQHKQISSIKRRKNNVYEIARHESYRLSGSPSDASASGTSGSAVSKNDAIVIPSTTVSTTESGFAKEQGVDWSKETSVTDCPAYATTYIPIPINQEPSDAKQDSDSTQLATESLPHKPIPCIYDTVHEVPRGIQYGAVNPRLAVISCVDDDDDDDDDSNAECETIGL